MKNLFKSLFILPLLLLLNVKTFAIEEYDLEKSHSYVIWRLSHFGFSDLTGKVFVEGVLKLDDKNIRNSSIEVKLPLEKATTGIKKLDDELLLNSYFDAKIYPNINFVSTQVKKTGDKSAVILGDLTIRDKTKPIEITINLVKDAKHPIYNRRALGFTGSAKLKRSDYGLRAYLPGVGDDVEIEIQAEAILKEANKPNAGENAH